jgi:hypothetical protein
MDLQYGPILSRKKSVVTNSKEMEFSAKSMLSDGSYLYNSYWLYNDGQVFGKIELSSGVTHSFWLLSNGTYFYNNNGICIGIPSLLPTFHCIPPTSKDLHGSTF